MALNGDKSKMGEFLRSLIDFIFGFKNKKGEILGHWISFVDGFSFPPLEFYSNLQKEMEARKIPSLEVSRVEFAEGGWLSDRRTYLRIIRERLAFDTCAAPFGTSYFFSCRTVYVPALVRLWHILAASLFLFLIWHLLVRPLGLVFATISIVTLLFALAGVLRNAAASALSKLDSLLLSLPVISTIYEDWFREDTYHREDMRLVYLKILPDLIKELADETCAAKGMKLEQFLRAAILDELYKRVPPKSSPPV